MMVLTYILVVFLISISKFHIMSPLNFTISPVTYLGGYNYDVTMSWNGTQGDTVGNYVICFSAENLYR